MMMRRARPRGTAFSVAARREVDIKLSIGAPCSIRRLGRCGPRGSAPLRRTILAGRTGPAGIGDHGRSRAITGDHDTPRKRALGAGFGMRQRTKFA
jgi:hypothetical protein